jgi:hypothetical protein
MRQSMSNTENDRAADAPQSAGGALAHVERATAIIFEQLR